MLTLQQRSGALRQLRERRRLTLRELARLTKINPAVISDLERQGDGSKHHRPLARYAGRLAMILGPAVLELAAPEQMALALDWRRARRMEDEEAREFLSELAREHAAKDLERRMEIWALPGGYVVLAPAMLTA